LFANYDKRKKTKDLISLKRGNIYIKREKRSRIGDKVSVFTLQARKRKGDCSNFCSAAGRLAQNRRRVAVGLGVPIRRVAERTSPLLHFTGEKKCLSNLPRQGVGGRSMGHCSQGKFLLNPLFGESFPRNTKKGGFSQGPLSYGEGAIQTPRLG